MSDPKEEVNVKTADAIMEDLFNELGSKNESGSDDNDSDSDSQASFTNDEDSKSKKSKKDKKHKKSKKKKKKKHKRSSSSRSQSRDRNSEKRRERYRSRSRDRESERRREKHRSRSRNRDSERKSDKYRSRSRDRKIERKRDKQSSSDRENKSKNDNIKRVSRPMSPPVVTRLWYPKDDQVEVRRHVPPPPPPEEWIRKDYRNKSSPRYRDDDRLSRSRDRRSRSREDGKSERGSSKRPKNEDDAFWDTKWEASQVQKKADDKESKGRHFLEPDRKKVRTPSPDRASDRSSSPETNEAKTLKRLKDIQDLVVKESEKYVADPPNPDLFEWDEKPHSILEFSSLSSTISMKKSCWKRST